VVVNDFNLLCAGFRPEEAEAELIVDADAVLAMSISAELLQAVAWRNHQIVETAGGIEDGQLAVGNAGEAAEAPGWPTLQKRKGVTASKRPDHLITLPPFGVPMQDGGTETMETPVKPPPIGPH
jgi:hypothetical protein